MKKCASCTKDLPDAALHCVFCGAKQPPAPAVQQGMAKTAFGYSANEMIDQLKQQQRPPGGAPGGYNQPRPAPMAPQQPYQPPHQPQQQYHPPTPAPPMAGGSPAPYPAPMVPAAGAHAATMYAGPPPQQMGQPIGGPMGQPMGPGPSMGGPMGPGPSMGGPMGARPNQMPPMGHGPQPIAPIPPAQPPPYLASQTAARAGRPIEPWKDSLRLMMFVWGIALLLTFAAPLSTDPMVFSWNIIIDGEGTQKLPPLILGAVGLLSVVIASIPMQPSARGVIAALLGLAGVIVPIALVGMPPWTSLVTTIGMLLIVPSLLVRNEYRESSLARILVTVGAIALLLPFLVPQGGTIPLVGLFKALIDLPGSAKLIAIIPIVFVVLVVLTLLAWVPSPATGAAKLWAWLLILFGLFAFAVILLVSGEFGMIKHSPASALGWIAGMGGGDANGDGAMFGVSVGAAYAVLVGYGLATVIGKQLE